MYNCFVFAYLRRNGKAYFTDFKLELGDELTDWTANPQDLYSENTNLVAIPD
jgi:hypothetical protein